MRDVEDVGYVVDMRNMKDVRKGSATWERCGRCRMCGRYERCEKGLETWEIQEMGEI